MVVLMLSVFTVSMGYGVTLPLLPYLIERLLGTSGDAAQVSRSTGLLTGLYTLSLFLFAPAWGPMSERYGRRDGTFETHDLPGARFPGPGPF